MDRVTAIVTVVLCLFGSGGIVLWFLNRIAKKNEYFLSHLKEK